ncbi:hypothetical protein ACSHT2_22040 [Bradyrhizobium sp. PUT101]
MRRRLIAWTIMTSALVAVTVWSMLGRRSGGAHVETDVDTDV